MQTCGGDRRLGGVVSWSSSGGVSVSSWVLVSWVTSENKNVKKIAPLLKNIF